MKINWTREALLRLQEIEEYIYEDNPEAAVKFVDKLISVTQDLIKYPEKGRVVPELSIDRFRELIYKNYRIVYLLKKKSIEILTVFESHKLLQKEDIIKRRISNKTLTGKPSNL